MPGVGGGGGMPQPWRHRAGSFDGMGAGVVAEPAAGGGGAWLSGGFLHAAFSGDGADVLACTATKFFRFPLGSR